MTDTTNQTLQAVGTFVRAIRKYLRKEHDYTWPPQSGACLCGVCSALRELDRTTKERED